MKCLCGVPILNVSAPFIAYYGLYGEYNERTTMGNFISKDFPLVIKDISPSFIGIYNEALFAEQHGLMEICGVGFRKALEFLIKDYSIITHPDEKDKILKKQLGPCIEEYVLDDRIKAVAKRAVWLGNDETHYVRKWEGKNLQDLKKLIDLTIHWIEIEALTKSFELDMPE